MKQHAKEPLPHERYLEWTRQNFQTGYYFETLKDDFLIGIAAVVVFLLRTKIRDHNWLKGNTDGDHRNCLIVENEGHTGIPILDLQQMDRQLCTIIAHGQPKEPSDRIGLVQQEFQLC